MKMVDVGELKQYGPRELYNTKLLIKHTNCTTVYDGISGDLGM